MLKDVISKLDYSSFDEVALTLFAVCFVCIVWATSKLRSESTTRFSNIPLSDGIVDPWVSVTDPRTNRTSNSANRE